MKRLAAIALIAVAFLGTSASAFTLAPDGSYVSGDSSTLTPDGSYVSGNGFELTPDGSYVGTD